MQHVLHILLSLVCVLVIMLVLGAMGKRCLVSCIGWVEAVFPLPVDLLVD